ncbi:hypothetical protein Vadar_026865 [Vaccinium darrowii]|uniref:Uncharacterized protein n=1 Tax=Vaccinium darrowii TaxID=229202 RepID=A0ACB7XUB6_9ERIC|nr:hypothetical protein Vadar_026865 [Vaccinium darrowii]
MRGETPLHMAAREGYADIVKALIECAKKVEQELESGLSGEAMKMLRATNVDRDTAMHMAARNCHLKLGNYLAVVRLLTEQDPEFKHPPNNVGETPLYLAAERGLSTKRLLESKNDLINQADAYGWTALHYAACNGNARSVKELLAKDKLGVYITTSHKDGLDTTLHIAAAQGHVPVIKELLSRNPDCWEMVNSKGENLLHIAVGMNMESVIQFILDQSWVQHLINQKDNEGNTPLHLLIASDCKGDELWKHPRADQHAVNAKDMTPIDLVWSNFKEASTSAFAATYIMDETFLDSAISGGRTIACNAYDNLAKLERARAHEKGMRKRASIAEKQRKAEATERKKKVVEEKDTMVFQTLVIVASLIATITFAAAFAIPGGYNGNQGSDQGMAVLARRAAFKGFVISNTIAMVWLKLVAMALGLILAVGMVEARMLEKVRFGMLPKEVIVPPSGPSWYTSDSPPPPLPPRLRSRVLHFGKLPKGAIVSPSGPSTKSNIPPLPPPHRGLHFGKLPKGAIVSLSGTSTKSNIPQLPPPHRGLHFGKLPKGDIVPPSGPSTYTSDPPPPPRPLH